MWSFSSRDPVRNPQTVPEADWSLSPNVSRGNDGIALEFVRYSPETPPEIACKALLTPPPRQ